MSSLKIFIVILNWNGKLLTLECLESLFKDIKGKKNISVIVVDNNSTDGSAKAFKKLQYPFKLIRNGENVGWAEGNNVGIRYALKQGADCVMLLANDSIIEKKTISSLVKLLFSKDEIGVVGPKIYKYGTKKTILNAGGIFHPKRYFGTDIGHGEKDNGQYDNLKVADYVVGTAITIKKKVFQDIGLFDDKLFIYYEDADFCLRARQKGYVCCYAQDAVVYHRGTATTKSGSPLHTYYNTRNHLIITERYASPSIKLRELIFRMPKTIIELIAEQDPIKKKYGLLGVRDYFLRRFGKRVYW